MLTKNVYAFKNNQLKKKKLKLEFNSAPPTPPPSFGTPQLNIPSRNSGNDADTYWECSGGHLGIFKLVNYRI